MLDLGRCVGRSFPALLQIPSKKGSDGEASIPSSELPEAGAVGRVNIFCPSEEKLVDAEKPKQVFEFYMFVWKIFYLCYLLLPLAA